MWGTFILDIYRREEAADLRNALEDLLGPESGSAWSTGGVYLFWDPVNRKPLYVGIAGDLPVRFAQHNSLRSCPAAACKREQIASYFDEHEALGYTVLALSSLSQPSTARQRDILDLCDRDLIELNEALSAEVLEEIRTVEGRLIADAKMRFGAIPPWNTSPGRIPLKPPDREDAVLGLAVGAADVLLQARKTIRELAATPEWGMFEERLHGARIRSTMMIVLSGRGSPDDLIRQELDTGILGIPDLVAEEIKKTGYLNQRCPVTV